MSFTDLGKVYAEYQKLTQTYTESELQELFGLVGIYIKNKEMWDKTKYHRALQVLTGGA